MDMVERVARAVYDNSPFILSEGVCRDIAIAAIEALRDPTDGMLDAADRVQHDCLQWSSEPGEGLDGMDWEPAYRAMIDSILKSTRETAPAQPVEEK
jgi:hypothetical protein